MRVANLHRVGLAALLAAATASAAQAELRQHGNLIYQMPQNWFAGSNVAGIRTLIFDGEDGVCDFCYIYLSAGAKKSGDLATFVQSKAPLFVDEDERGDIEVLQPPSVMSMGQVSVALYGVRVDGNLLLVMGFELPDRFELVAFDGPASDEEELMASMATFQSDAQPLFGGLQFVSLGAASLLPEPTPGPLDGVYWGWHNDWEMNIDGTMQLVIDHRVIVFWPDGTFYDGEPPEGLKPLERDALMAVADSDFGSYTVSGDTLSLAFADGVREELTADGDGWNDGETVLGKVRPLADGSTFDGTLSSFRYVGFMPGSGVQGGVSFYADTVFKADGTYTGSSFSGASGNFVDGFGDLTGGYTTSSESSEGGRYEVRDGLIVQYPSDGSAPRSKLAFDGGDGMILIGEEFLETE